MAYPRARNVVADLAARGRYHFTSSELRSALGVHPIAAARQALSRLAGKGLVAVRERTHRAGRVIPRDDITHWWERAPWSEDFQVEQDLVISPHPGRDVPRSGATPGRWLSGLSSRLTILT